MDNGLKGEPRDAAGPMSRQRAWANSPAGKLAARRAGEKSVAARRLATKCGARRKSDGQPCRIPALEGRTRCRLHGGASGRGAQWHVIQWPGPDAPPEKLEKKLREIERRRKRRALRVAAMTPEERARYDKQSRAMRPRSSTVRAHERQARDAIKLLSGRPAPAPASPEANRLQARIAALDAEKVQLEALLAADSEATEQNTTGIHDDR